MGVRPHGVLIAPDRAQQRALGSDVEEATRGSLEHCGFRAHVQRRRQVGTRLVGHEKNAREIVRISRLDADWVGRSLLVQRVEHRKALPHHGSGLHATQQESCQGAAAHGELRLQDRVATQQVNDLAPVHQEKRRERDASRDCDGEDPGEPRRGGPTGASFAGLEWRETLHVGRTRDPLTT